MTKTSTEPGFDTGREITPAAACKRDKTWLTPTLCSRKAMRLRREVLGAEYVDASARGRNSNQLFGKS
jgi:hypothetical protein